MGTSPVVVQRDDLLVHGSMKPQMTSSFLPKPRSRVGVVVQAVDRETRHPACDEESGAVTYMFAIPLLALPYVLPRDR